MIIRELHIDGFGIFRDRSFTDLTEGINLFTGENEAGKSTLLKFIRYTLFGYPRSIEERMHPLAGGAHGGRIRTLLSSGREVTFERMNEGKEIRLIHDGNESPRESDWIQLLGHATGHLFNNVYAITLDELQGLASLSASGVEDKIFSVGLGLGATSLGKIEEHFAERSRQIYLSRGKVQVIPQILKRIEEKKKRSGRSRNTCRSTSS